MAAGIGRWDASSGHVCVPGIEIVPGPAKRRIYHNQVTASYLLSMSAKAPSGTCVHFTLVSRNLGLLALLLQRPGYRRGTGDSIPDAWLP